MRKPILALAALLPAALLAVNIDTAANDAFFDIPSWMPTSVASKDTPGSSAFFRHALATTNEAARLFEVLGVLSCVTIESSTNLYAAFVRRGAINTNDLYDICRNFYTYYCVNTNQARQCYSAMASNGVITAVGAASLIKRFDSSVEFITNAQGRIIGHYGTISQRDAGFLYGALARKDHITVTNAAALYACYDGYCQRVYHMNCGRVNSWDQSEYGGLTPYDFSFPADFGSRTNANFRAIGFRTNMQALASNIAFDKFSVYRPSWPSGTIYVGSTSLNSLPGETLDPYGLDGNLSWSSTIPDGRMVVLRSLLYDSTYNPRPVSNIWTAAWRSIGHGEPYLDTLPKTNSCAVTYEAAVTNTIGPSSWNVANVTNVPRVLDSMQAWMGAAAQGLTFIDRSYEFLSVYNPSTKTQTDYSSRRDATYSNGSTFHVSVYGESGEISPVISVSSNDWSVGGAYGVTNDTESAFYEGDHFRDLAIVPGTSSKAFQCGSIEVERYALDSQYLEDVFDSIVPLEEPSTNSLKLYCSDQYGSSMFVEAEINESYPYVVGTFTPLNEYDISGIELSCTVRHAYSRHVADIPRQGTSEIRQTVGENEYASSQKFTVLGSILVNKSAASGDSYDGDSRSQYVYGQTIRSDGNRTVYSNEVDRFAAEMDAIMKTSSRALWGEYERPSEFITIAAADALSRGTIKYVTAGINIPSVTWYGKIVRGEDGGISVIDFYSVTEEGVTNAVPWSGNIVSCGRYLTPQYETSDTSATCPDVRRRAVGDAKAAMMTDFEFGALKNDL